MHKTVMVLFSKFHFFFDSIFIDLRFLVFLTGQKFLWFVYKQKISSQKIKLVKMKCDISHFLQCKYTLTRFLRIYVWFYFSVIKDYPK